MSSLAQQYIDHTARADNSKVAVTDGLRTFSHREVEIYSNRLANRLIACGVKRQDRVAFCLQRSIEVPVVVLGILKADAIYVPIDGKSPLQRWKDILDDCTPAAVICDRQSRDNILKLKNKSGLTSPIVVLDTEGDSDGDGFGGESINLLSNRHKDSRPTYHNSGEDLAYILYTSGSTGKPKGVMISHENIRNYIDWAVNYFRIAQDERILGTAPFHFDMSTFDLYCSFRTGCTFCVAGEETTLFPNKLVDLIEQEGITLWKGISSLLMYMAMAKVLESHRMPSLKQIIFAGEPFPSKYLIQWMRTYPEKVFYNGYGPTEATGISLCYRVGQIPGSQHDRIPIGTPRDGTTAHLFSEDNQPVRAGEVGELCLAGSGLSRGYLNDESKTSAAFVDYCADGTSERIYKTGDLAVLLTCGNYQFVGRKDRQLKFMGYRIEAGEVEHAILSLDGVNDAAVILHGSKSQEGAAGMVAFVEASESSSEWNDLAALKNHLPAYMIPKRFIRLDKMPRCPRGKVNYPELKTLIDI